MASASLVWGSGTTASVKMKTLIRLIWARVGALEYFAEGDGISDRLVHEVP